MTATALNQIKPATWQLTLGSEGIAAAQFSRCGLDVSVQSGRDKPWYDLVVAKAGNLLKVSVKGSDDGQWALVQSYMKRAAGRTAAKFEPLVKQSAPGTVAKGSGSGFFTDGNSESGEWRAQKG